MRRTLTLCPDTTYPLIQRTHPLGIGSKSGIFSTSHNTAGAALAPPAPSVAHNFVVVTDADIAVRAEVDDLIPNAFICSKQHEIMVDAIQNVYPDVHGFIVCYFVVDLIEIAVEQALPFPTRQPTATLLWIGSMAAGA